jgi:glycosyltransferase involved in cell wall biosynthesis
MKIGIDARTLMDRRFSGVSEYTFNLVNEILRQDRSDEFILFYNSWKKIGLPRIDETGARIVKLGFPNKIFNYLLQKTLRYPKLDRLLETDLFFLPHINFGALERPERAVLTIHDLSFLRYPHHFSLRKNCWHKLLAVKKLARSCGRIVAVSENTKRDIVELFQIDQSKISVIHSGLSPGFSPADQGDAGLDAVRVKYGLPAKFILFLGTVEPRKNLAGLIAAYEKMIAASPSLADFELVIAGARGWKTESIFEKWERSPLKDRITFLGYVDAADKRYLYNLASLFVYPSFYEGFGFPPLEAMACGIPAAVSSSSSLPEICGSAAIIFDPYDESDIARVMGLILSDGVLSSDLADRGMARAADFSWQAAAARYISLFRSIAF